MLIIKLIVQNTNIYKNNIWITKKIFVEIDLISFRISSISINEIWFQVFDKILFLKVLISSSGT